MKRFIAFILTFVLGLSTGAVVFATPDYQVGDVVIFGSYEEDNDTSNGNEPIEWLVLAAQEDQILLISKYALDYMAFKDKYTKTPYENSDVRKWLNDTFYETAFSKEEKEYIIQTKVDNSKSQGNSNWNPESQNNTKDNVFLLSYVEADSLFANSERRECIATTYAKGQGAASGYKTVDWWLRSPGKERWEACSVSITGYLGRESVATCLGVRPAIWVNINAPLRIDPSVQTATGPAVKKNDSKKVWVTDNGKKYHRNSGCSHMKNPYQITINEAISRGLDACEKCG